MNESKDRLLKGLYRVVEWLVKLADRYVWLQALADWAVWEWTRAAIRNDIMSIERHNDESVKVK